MCATKDVTLTKIDKLTLAIHRLTCALEAHMPQRAASPVQGGGGGGGTIMRTDGKPICTCAVCGHPVFDLRDMPDKVIIEISLTAAQWSDRARQRR